MGHGQNLNLTSGEPEFVAQKFFKIPGSGFTFVKGKSHGKIYFFKVQYLLRRYICDKNVID
jgi:hypothetical protein